MIRALYITYDGLSDPLGQSQILPHLKRLAKNRSVHWTILSFEKDLAGDCIISIEKGLSLSGIEWLKAPYHKGGAIPLISKIYDLISGIVKVLRTGRRYDVIHARSYVAAFIAMFFFKKHRNEFIFDMRGFWPEERVDGGLWKKDGILFKISKIFEKKILQMADHVVVLTDKAKNELTAGVKYPVPKAISVIPTCADVSRFSNKNEKRRIPYSFCYSGSIGTWYALPEMIGFISFLREKNLPATLHFIVNEFSLKNISSQIYSMIHLKDFLSLESSSYEGLPLRLGQFQFGFYFIRPCYSKTSSCPTKLAEFLAMGMPVITNRGIGDCDQWIEKEGLGVLVDDFTPSAYLKAFKDMEALLKDPGVMERCVRFVKKNLSLETAVTRYEEIYQRLLSGDDSTFRV